MISLSLHTPFFTTKNIPHLKSTLKRELPFIFQTTCYNSSNHSFEKEVTHTPIGHLFEHILLEYLCDEKINQGEKEAHYKGLTTWDWTINAFGTYSIQINISLQEIQLFFLSLNKTIILLTRLLEVACEKFISIHPKVTAL